MKTNLKNVSHISILLAMLLCTYCREDDFLDGYDRNELFSDPTPSELDAVRSGWSSRAFPVTNYKIEQESKIAEAGATLKIVSFSVNGHKEYGALVIPAASGKLPVRMYVGGFSIDSDVNSINLVADNINDDPFIFAFPALRGQSLSVTINNIGYTSPVSEGEHCDAFDGAADDIIAFLNVIENTEAGADVHRTVVRGGSRGATVALLVAARDKRVKGAIGIAGPVNLLELTSSNENDKTYQCQFLRDLVENGHSPESARLKMIASSPVYFAELLPKTQLHLGENDRIVPVSQGEELKAAMTKLGRADSLDFFIYEGRTHQNMAIDNKLLSDRITEFLKQF